MGIVRFLIRLLIGLLFILPLVWMISAALHPLGVPLPRTLQLLPETPTLENFSTAWTLAPIAQYTLTTFGLLAAAIPLTLLTSSWAGFAIAQLPQASQRRWVLGSLFLLLVPSVALWLPRFIIYKQLYILNTPIALLMPALMGTSPFYVLMYYRAFRRLSATLYDAARVDGANVLDVWARIAFPLARPTTAAVALLTFLVYWGDFNSPLLYTRTERFYTVPVALQYLEQLVRTEWAVLMAGATLVTIVPLLLFGMLQFTLRRSLD